jgi:hypothetical protein
MKRLLLLLFPLVAFAQNPITIPNLPHAATLTGTEIVPMNQGTCSTCTVGATVEQFYAFIAPNIFSPGGALGGSYNSQTVNLSAGATFILGSLPLTSIGFNTTAATSLSNVGPIPQWIHVASGITYTFFSAASTTSTQALFSLPASGVIHGCKVKHSVSFSGGSITAYTVSVGDGGSTVAYGAPFDVFQAVGATAYKLTQTFGGESATATSTIYATATSTGGNLSTATTGALDVWCLISVAL